MLSGTIPNLRKYAEKKHINNGIREYLKRLPAYVIIAVAKKEIVSKRCTNKTPRSGGSSGFLLVLDG